MPSKSLFLAASPSSCYSSKSLTIHPILPFHRRHDDDAAAAAAAATVQGRRAYAMESLLPI